MTAITAVAVACDVGVGVDVGAFVGAFSCSIDDEICEKFSLFSSSLSLLLLSCFDSSIVIRLSRLLNYISMRFIIAFN